jgi:small subunit ribosomal protein S15
MSVTKEVKQTIITKHGSTEADTGRTEVQVAILSTRITELTAHLKTHTKDHSSRRGLLKLVGQRRRLLKYLKAEKLEVYRGLIAELGLRK